MIILTSKALVLAAICAQCCASCTNTDPLLAPVLVTAPFGDLWCFASLDEALEASTSLTYAKVEVLPTSDPVALRSEWTVASEVAVFGSTTVLLLSGQVTVAATGRVTLEDAHIEVSGDYEVPVFVVGGGTLVVRNAQVAGGNRQFIEADGGSLSVTNTTFRGLGNSVMSLHSPSFVFSIGETEVMNCSSLLDFTYQRSGSEGRGVLVAVNVYSSAQLLICTHCEPGGFHLDISNSAFVDSRQELVSGSIGNLELNIESVSMRNIASLFSGSIYNSSIHLRNSTINLCKGTFINLSVLTGRVFIIDTAFTEILQGPLISLPSNPFPPAAAIVSFLNISIAFLTNAEGAGALFCCGSTTLLVDSVSVRDSYIYASGLFHMTAGVVHLSHIKSDNNSGYLGTMFEAVASELVMTDCAFQGLSVDTGYYAYCIYSSNCYWRNVTVTDSLDPNPPYYLIYMWTAFASNITIASSYFHNAGRQSIITMGATNGACLTVRDTVFEDLWSLETFGAYTDSFVSFSNITLIRPRLDVLFSCVFTPACLHADSLSVLGEADIKVLIQANSGTAVIQGTSFEAISQTVIRATNANVTLDHVTVRNFRGTVCSNCVNTVLALQSFVLEDVVTVIPFQMTFSELLWMDVKIRNIACQQLLMLESSRLLIANSEFEAVRTDSYAGLIGAISSAVIIDSSNFHSVLGSLSLYIGLIYLESSTFEVRNSSFSDFNCTLIHSVDSPAVSLTDSQFSSPAAHASKSLPSSVKLRGNVLWSERTLAVAIAGCRFTNLAAESGGALYLSGSGIETCDIDNSTANDNNAKGVGGFLYSDDVSVAIRNCNFVNNTAEEGGALALFGSIHNTLLRVRFAGNSVLLAGGAVTYRQNNTAFALCEWSNNTALYGPNIASEVSSLSVLDKDSHGIITNYSIDAVSGQAVNIEILIGCVDYFDQIVFTDNQSKLSLFTEEANSSIIISNLLESSSGMYRIPSLTVIGAPGSTLSIYGTHGRKLTVLLLTVRLRECVAGEYQSALQCKPCSHNTYSFSPAQPCTLCPDQADCLGGAVMSLHRGYWRQHNATDEILQCIVPDLCVGGVNSDCAAGHTGLMCSTCEDGYTKMNQLQCMSCVNAYVPLIRAALAAVFSMLAIALSYRRKSVLALVTVLDYLQSLWITTHYSLFWPEATAHFSAIAGDLGSLGLTTFTGSCIGSFGSIPMVYSQLVVLMVHTAMVGVAVSALGCMLISRTKRLKRCLRLLFYAYFLVLPVAFQRGIQLLPYFNVAGKQYLIFDSSTESWTPTHLTALLTTSVPLGAFVLTSVCYLCSAATKRHRTKCLFPPWKARNLLVLFLRKLLLAVLLAFPNSLSLCTQAAISIALNISAETVASRLLPTCASLQLYKLCLIASTTQSFFAVIHSASGAATATWGFSLGCLSLQFSPALYGIWAYRQRVAPAQVEEAVDLRNIVLQESSQVPRPPEPSSEGSLDFIMRGSV